MAHCIKKVLAKPETFLYPSGLSFVLGLSRRSVRYASVALRTPGRRIVLISEFTNNTNFLASQAVKVRSR